MGTAPATAAPAGALSRDAWADPTSAVRRTSAIVGPPALILLAQAVLFPAPAAIWVLGAELGLLTALVALGMALVYRASRILNFAQADLGTAPVVLTITLVTTYGWNYYLGLGIGLAAALAVGALVELLVIRRFFRAPRLILTVATIGLSQLFTVIGLLIFRQKQVNAGTGAGSENALANLTVKAPFTHDFTIGPRLFTANDLIALVVAPLVVVGLAVFLRRTIVGVALRAAAERADRASLLGVPVKRLQMLVWSLATVMSFVGLFLRAGVLGLPAVSTASFAALASALTALMVGRLTNLPAITLAALSLGVLEQGVVWNNGNNPNVVYPVQGVVILLALVVRRIGTSRAEQESVASWQSADEVRTIPKELRRLPEVLAVKWGGAALLLAVALVLPHLLDVSNQFKAANLMVFGLIGVSIVVLTGWAGQVSLGQMSFAAVGAAISAVATETWHLDLSLTIVLAGIGGAVAATVVGIPALRLRGLFLAVTTLGFALATSSYLLSTDQARWIPTRQFDPPPLFHHFDLSSQISRYYVCLACLLLGLVAVRGLRRGRTGRVLLAVRENEPGSQAYGVGILQAKLTAFAVSGFLAAVAGCLLVQVYGQYIDQSYTPSESFAAFTSAVVGGVGSLAGGLLGALFLNGGKWLIPSGSKLVLLPSAIGVLFVLLVIPGGISRVVYRLRDRLLRVVANRRGIRVPSLVADTGETADEDGALAQAAGSATEVDRRVDAEHGVDAPEPAPRLAPAVRATGDGDGLLSVRGLDVAYGDVQILFDVDVDVAEGEIIALLGTNGAGKSTLLKAICGVVPTRSGTVTFDGRDITKLPAERVAALHLSQVPGGQGVFPSLTVAENLRVAGWLHRHDHQATREGVERAYRLFPALDERRADPAANLSGGQQQMLGLAMALLGKPRLLAIDELSLGLAPAIVEQLLEVVTELRDEGTTIVLVEQSVNVALTVAETAYFMEKGQIRFHGATSDLLERPDVLRSVFLEGAAAGMAVRDGDGADPAAQPAGAPVDGAGPDVGSPPDRAPAVAATANGGSGAALDVRDLSVRFGGIRAVSDVSFTIAPREIVGVIGPNGAGKTTLFDLISGFTSADSGVVRLGGVDVSGRSAPARARLGLGRSFQDARLFPSLTVEEALAVALERSLDVHDPLNAMLRTPVQQDSETAVWRRVDELLELLGIEDFRTKFVAELSTGSRRVVDLACVIAHRPAVVLLDEPSSGIAQREAEALGPLLERIRDSLDASLVVIEHDIALVTSVADRLIAMDQGEVVVIGTSDEVLHHPEVVASYLGSGGTASARSGARRADAPAAAPTPSATPSER